MSDNYLDKLNEEQAAAEALRKAERIKAIRASLHREEEQEAAAAPRVTPPVQAPPAEEESFAEKFKRVKQSKLAAQNKAAEAPAEVAAPIEETAPEEAAPVQEQAPAEEAPAAEIPPQNAPAEPQTAVQTPPPARPTLNPMRKPREAWANTPHTEPRMHTDPKKKKKKKKKPKTLGQKLRGLFPEKGDKPLEIVRKFVFLGSLVAIVVCGYMVGDYYLDLWRSRMEYSNIDDIYRTYTPIITSVEDEKPVDDKYYDLLPGAKKLLDINPEVVGYMTIPTIDGDPIVALPVVQAEDNSKYLDINFKGENSRAGALFLDWRNSFDKVEDHRLVEKNSDNLIVYGHNMADESMFGALKYYRRYENYYESHPIIEFNSNYEQYTYKIFSFFLLDAEDDSDTEYDCWNTLNFDDEEEFYDFVNEAKRRTLRTNDVDVKYGDQILTISTCNTDVIGNDRGRLILMARRVRAGEDLYSGTKGSKANPNIKWPNVYYESRPNEKYDPAQFVPYGPSTTETKANIEE
ncbi:MAG: class B sortase [Ruminococcus sp.]|nr:class B sortase [Ruminococcus sp.]